MGLALALIAMGVLIFLDRMGTGYGLREGEGISGATILGDGSVALILDVPKLIQTVEREETKA